MTDRLNEKALFIDFDSTFVKVETIDELARLTLQNDPDKDSKIDLISGITNQAMSGEIDFPAALERRLQILSLTSDSLKEITHQITSLVSDSFKANREIIKEHCDDIWIISGGFSQIISAIVSPYGISGDHILANTFLFEGDRVVGCDKSNPLFQDKGKIKAIGSIETGKERVVVGDGHTDLEVYLEGVAEHFICYTENVHRQKVVNQSKHIASSFEQMLEILNRI